MFDLDNLLESITPSDLTPKEETLKVKEDNGIRVYQDLHYSDILPKEGKHLALDVSETSTGMALLEDGKLSTLSFETKPLEGAFGEVLLRRSLAKTFVSFFKDYTFDTVLIEDAYAGKNPKTVRLLYALNTAIDECLLDDYFSTKDFQRVNNRSWKGWLWGIEPQLGKGLEDKERIRLALENLGVSEEGEGFQDRLDATGLLVGFFFHTQGSQKEPLSKPLWSQVGLREVSNLDDLSKLPKKVLDRPLKVIDLGTRDLSRDYLKYLLSIHPDSLLALTSSRSMELNYALLGLGRPGKGTLIAWRK